MRRDWRRGRLRFVDSLLIIGYRLGKGLEEHRDRVAGPQRMVGTGIFPQKTPVPGFSGGG
jgi:hypothetical protein